MKKEFNKEKIAGLIRELITEIGGDIKSEGLAETPERVARMYEEVFEGMRYSNGEIAAMFDKCFEMPENNDLVVVRDIEVFSYCEHHLALMYNMRVHVDISPTAG